MSTENTPTSHSFSIPANNAHTRHSMLNPELAASATRGKPTLTEGGPDLEKLLEQKGLNSLHRLLRELDVLAAPEGELVEKIQENILNLQEAFLADFYALYKESGQNKHTVPDQNTVPGKHCGAGKDSPFDAEEKITLRLNQNEELAVLAESTDATRLEAKLAARPELALLFKEIAVQADLMRNLKSISRLLRGELYSGAEYARPPACLLYQLGIKGEMNHFYFARG